MEEINFNQIKRLWNLKLVIETGSIKKAATRANVTSSAMSQSISGLEQAIGRKLLLRKREKLLPTEHAAQLLRSAEPAFHVCSDLHKNLSGTCAVLPKMTWLDLAATESIAVDILPEIMKRLRSHFPEIRLKVKSGRSSDLTKAVKKGELCMAVVEDNDFIQGVTAIPLAEERLGFYVSAKISDPSKRSSWIDALGVGVLASGPDGHPGYFTKLIKSLGTSFKPTLTSESYEVLRTAAVEGSVVSLLPSRVAQRHPGELIEIVPESLTGKALTNKMGRYAIYLACQPGCSSEENIFLATELKSIISSAPLGSGER